MIIQRVITGVATAAALVAAGGVLVVAGGFAVFSLLQGFVGPSGAAAIIALFVAAGLVAGALVLPGRANLAKETTGAAASSTDQSLPQRLFYLMQERPVVAAGAAVAAGLIAWRNPRLLGAVSGLLALGRQRT